MAIPRQKKERVWNDPDEGRITSIGDLAGAYRKFFSIRFFILGIGIYLLIHSLESTYPITITGITIAIIVSALFSPLLEILYREVMGKSG